MQQAILQVLTPLLDPTFSNSSYGFRPKRGAHDALAAAKRYVEEGRTIVVNLERFSDRVNHDILMARRARRVADKHLLRVVRRFLEAGLMQDGVCIARHEGTPQGGPLSPLLANLLLDDWDRELERRGHRFCRYADDCNVDVQSPGAGERVMASLIRFLEGKLRLRVKRQAAIACQPGEERGGAGPGAHVPGRSTPGGRAVGDGAQESGAGQRSYSADHPKEPRNRLTPGGRRVEQLPHRVGDVLPPCGDAEPVTGCGWLDSAEAALRAVEGV